MTDLTIYEGADFAHKFQIVNSLGDIVDVTNYTGKSEVRDSAGTLIATFAVAMGTTDGYLDMTLDDLVTDQLTVGSYVYDIFITNATTGDVQNVGGGSVSVIARITL